MRFTTFSLGALLLAVAAPAAAQDAAGTGQTTTPASGNTTPGSQGDATVSSDAATTPTPLLKLSGGVTLTSDYRFRGLTQTDGDPALQTTLTVNSRPGFYVGTWMSEIDGSGRTPALRGYGDAEVDLFGGFTKTLKNGVGIDVGLLYYYYPGGIKGQNTDFFEPYGSLTYTLGPVAAKAGVAYAWGGQKGLDFTSGHDDDIYAYAEASLAIPTTPVTLKGHIGRTDGALGLVNLNAGDDTYYDWSVTAEAVGGPLKVGVSYVDTDITSQYDAALGGRFDQRLGRGSTVLGYVGFAF